MREAVTITAGSVIGVGLFTTGSNVVGNLGVEVIFATLLALLVSIYPALLYAEMGAALPYAGGTYQFASLGLGKAVGVLAGWNFIISLVAVTGGEALAFSYYFKTLCLAFGWQIPLSNVAVALIVTIGFIIANVFGVRLPGRLQNGFMFFFWGVAAIWFLTMIPNIELPNFVKSPEFIAKDKDFTFIGAVCMIWWCFAGFEACVAMGEEIRFPKINIPRAMFLAPFVVFCVNALFQWYLIGITPVEKLASLATAEAPYAEAMKAQVDSAKFVSFSSPSIAGVGYEPVLSGLAPVSENGKLVGPVKGSRGVYVFTVTDKTVSEQPFDAQTETQKIQQNYGYLINSRLMEVLRDKAEIENTMIRFF